MRNKVGQEATGEMSAFKGVVNLFIVVLPHLSQHVRCFQGGPRTNPESTQVLSDCETAREKAPLVMIFGSDSFYFKKLSYQSQRGRGALTHVKQLASSGAEPRWPHSARLQMTPGWSLGNSRCSPAAGRGVSAATAVSVGSLDDEGSKNALALPP